FSATRVKRGVHPFPESCHRAKLGLGPLWWLATPCRSGHLSPRGLHIPYPSVIDKVPPGSANHLRRLGSRCCSDRHNDLVGLPLAAADPRVWSQNLRRPMGSPCHVR